MVFVCFWKNKKIIDRFCNSMNIGIIRATIKGHPWLLIVFG